MKAQKQNMTICLWFDEQAEEAARFYTSVFPNSALGPISRYHKEGNEVHGKPEGSVMTVEFGLNGMEFVALNGGPHFKFNEAISVMIHCHTQEEIDYYWTALTDGGGEEGPCGWVKDKYGVSWQIVPVVLIELLRDPTKAANVTQAYLKMKKFDIQKILNA